MTYPSYPGMRPAEGGGEPPPTAGTAITAGVLAVLGGLFMALAAWGSFDAVDFARGQWLDAGLTGSEAAQLESLIPDWVETYSVITGIVAVLASLQLLLGAFFLLSRVGVGRWLVVAGCVVAIGFAIAGMVALPALVDDMITALEQQTGRPLDPDVPNTLGPMVIFIVLPAVATLVLSLVPVTGRWLAAGRRRPVPGGQW